MITLGNMLQNMESIKDEIQGAAEAGGKQAMVVCKDCSKTLSDGSSYFKKCF